MQMGMGLLKYRNTGYIRWLGIAVLVIILADSAAFALDPMGPPTAVLEEGQFDIGGDYSSSSMDIELTHGKWSELLNGEFYGAGEAVSFELKDFDIDKMYAHFGYCIWENCEVYLRLGGAGAEFGDSIWEDKEKFDSNTNFSFCIGSRATFFEDGDLKLGRLIQISWANLDGGLMAGHWTEADSVDIDLMEIQIAVGPTYRLSDGFSIYGGPFFHFVDGELKDTFNETTEKGVLTSKYIWEIDETSTFGGYIGAKLDIDENSCFNVEYQRTAGADALGLSLILGF